MWRWTKRTLLGVNIVIIVAASAGAIYEWAATRRLAATPPPGRLEDIGGHRLHIWSPGRGRLRWFSRPDWEGRASTGASSSLRSPDSRGCARPIGQESGTEMPASPRTARRIARELAGLLDRSGIREPVVLVGASIGGFAVRVFASESVNHASGLVLVDASHEDQQHEIPRLAPFVPLLSSVGILRLAGVTFGLPSTSLAPPVGNIAHATRFRAAGYQAAADEIIHVRESATEVRDTRRTLTIPVVVVTAGRGTDPAWEALQRDQVALSQQSCQIIAEQAGHAVAAEQPEVVVNAIRAVVDAIRKQGRIGPQCGSRVEGG